MSSRHRAEQGNRVAESSQILLNLVGVIVAVTDEVPRVVVTEESGRIALPNGPFDPMRHASLEAGLRDLISVRTGLDLFYVEQLYTFGNRYRDPSEFSTGRRTISVAYIALTHENPLDAENVRWADWYRFLPWEDWRAGRPEALDETIRPALQAWIRKANNARRRNRRQERVHVTFGEERATEMDAVLALERFELLYEAALAREHRRDALMAAGKPAPRPAAEPHDLGTPMASDHRRILATALGRLRGKLAYRPVVFELLPGEFTLLQLQRVAEALSGARLHKQNFRRLVTNADLVEPVGRTSVVGRGRPAELFRFRREVLGEKLTVGLSRPVMREDAP